MFCPNCGAQAEGGKFCASCGSPLPMVPKSTVTETPQEAPAANLYAAAPQAAAAAQPQWTPEAPAQPQWTPEAPVQPQPQPQWAPEATIQSQTQSLYQWTPDASAQSQPQPQPQPQWTPTAPAQPQYQWTPDAQGAYASAPTEPQAEAPVKDGKKPKNKALLWILVAAGGLILLAGIALLVIFLFLKKDPTAQVAAAAAKTMSSVKQTEAGKFSDELDKSQVKVSMDLSSLSSQIGYRVDGTLDVTLSSDMDAGRMSLALALLMKGKEVADLDILMDESAMAVRSDTILGNDVYGLTFATLPDDLEKSIFNPKSRTNYPLPEELYNMLLELDESPITLYKESRGAIEKLAEKGGAKLLESLKKHAEITEEDGTLTVGGTRVECKVVKAVADEAATRAITEELVEWIKGSEAKEELTRFFKVAAKVQQIANAADGSSERVEPEDLLKEFYDGLDDALEDLEDSSSELYFYINKVNEQLIGFRMDAESREETNSLELVFGPDCENPTEIRMTLDSDGEKTECLVNVLENTDSALTLEITVNDDGDAQTVEFAWKKKRGQFTVSTNGYTMVSGTLKIEGDTLSLGVDGTGISMELTRGGKTEAVPKFENIVTMKEEDFTDLLNDIQEEIQNLVYSLMR